MYTQGGRFVYRYVNHAPWEFGGGSGNFHGTPLVRLEVNQHFGGQPRNVTIDSVKVSQEV